MGLPLESVDEILNQMRLVTDIELAGLTALAEMTVKQGGTRDDMCKAIGRLAAYAWQAGHMDHDTRGWLIEALGGQVP